MTLKEKKNHFKIKFLKGYGFSVRLHGKKIQLKNNFDPFSEPQIEEYFINKLPYEKIVLQGNGYISSDALKLLTENGRQLVLVDHEGNPSTIMNGLMSSQTSTDYRIGQYDTFRNKSKRAYLSKQIVKAKLESQIKYLESKNTRLLSAIIEGRIQDIGKIRPKLKKLNLNADRKRLWFGGLKNVKDKTCNESLPLSFNYFSKDEI